MKRAGPLVSWLVSPSSEILLIWSRLCKYQFALYACWAGPSCRDPSYPVPGSRFKRAVFSHINGRNGPDHLRPPLLGHNARAENGADLASKVSKNDGSFHSTLKHIKTSPKTQQKRARN